MQMQTEGWLLFCGPPVFGQMPRKKTQTCTQKFNIIPNRYFNISFEKGL
jgi:hypothetical protein